MFRNNLWIVTKEEEAEVFLMDFPDIPAALGKDAAVRIPAAVKVQRVPPDPLAQREQLAQRE